MRHTLLISFAALLALAVGAGAADMERSLEQTFEQFESARRDAVFSALHLSPEESRAFTPLYDGYRERCRKLVDRKVAQLRDYATILGKGTVDAKAVRSLSREMFSIERQQLSDLQWQVDRVARVLPPEKALQYMLLEVQLDHKAKDAALRFLPGFRELPNAEER